MALFRPWRSGRVEYHEKAVWVIASRDMARLRGYTQHRGLHCSLLKAFDGICMNGLHILLAIILLHDIFAPHPFASTMILLDSNLSLQTLDESHPSTAGFVEEDESTSVPNRREALIPALSVKFNGELHPFFHPLLIITADERPPKV
jgi:hypothetical protein